MNKIILNVGGPLEYLYELDFYNVHYPKYDESRDDIVILDAQGTIYKIKAPVLIKGSKYFAEKLPHTYIGQSIFIDYPADIFNHVIERTRMPEYYRAKPAS